MASNHDYVALDWVQGEIVTTLEEAQAALEAYVGQPEDKSRLRFCLNHLHQVHGTLLMVEFYGAAVLAEEMEKLAAAILKDTVASQEEALEVLMESMLQLPNCLERLKQSRHDLPLVLMPTLNDLRAARGEALLTNNALFNPDLSHARRAPTADQSARMRDPRTVVQLRKVRQMYQFALVGVIREKEMQTNLDFMHKSLSYLEGLTRGTRHEPFWRIAGALIEAFEHKQFNLSLSIKSLLRSVDLRIKKMIEEPLTILDQKLPEDTLKNLLYYIACAEPVTPRLKSIRDDYRLDEALPRDAALEAERAKLAGPDRSALTSVSGALNEELARIKDQLDLFVRSSTKDIEDLLGMLPSLTQISNTLTILGMGVPRKLIQDLVERLERLAVERRVPGDDALMHMASLLLQVENQLAKFGMQGAEPRVSDDAEESFIPRDQLADAHEAVIREARNGIEQAKLAIVEFIGSQWDLSHIEKVPEHLRSIEGGLRIIPLHKAAALMGACANFIQNTLIDQGKTPDWSQLDTLADAVTSIEYYLERITEGGEGNETILQVAEDSLQRLMAEEGLPTVTSLTGLATPVQAPDLEAAERLATGGQPLAGAQSAPLPASAKAADSDLIDDEIREIFVEEAGEVIATMLAHFPTWQDNPFDRQALIELRRAFHTLKGSGRLVGATEIGELSWAVENLLNRVIDGTLEPGLAIFELVEKTMHRIPALIDDFSASRGFGPVQDLIDAANLLVSTRSRAIEGGEDSSPANELAPPRTATVANQPERPSAPRLDELPGVAMAAVTGGVTEAAASAAGHAEGDEGSKEIGADALAAGTASDALAVPLGATPDQVIAKPERHADADTAVPVAQSAATPQPAAPQPAADDELIDAEIIEIFVEEAAEVLDTIAQHLPVYLNNYEQTSALTEIRRAFHTLKGSGRMVGARAVGELSWSIENLLNRIIDHTIHMTTSLGDLITTVVGILPDLVRDFEQRRSTSHDITPLVNHAHAIAKGELPSSAPLPGVPGSEQIAAAPTPVPATVAATPELATEPASEAPLASVSTASASIDLEADIPALTIEQQVDLGTVQNTMGIDPALLEIFQSETEVHLQTLREFVARAAREHQTRISDDVSRALHTLKGSANTAAVRPIAEIVIPTEKLFKELRQVGGKVDERLASLLDEMVGFVAAGLAQLHTRPQHPLEGADAYLERLATLGAELLDSGQGEAGTVDSVPADVQLLNLFLTEGIDILLDAERILDEWSHQGLSAPEQHMLVTELQTLAQGAQLAGLDDVRRLSTALAKAYRDIETRHLQVSADFFEVAKAAHEQLINMMDQVAAGLATHIDGKLLAELEEAVAVLPQTLPSSVADTALGVPDLAAGPSSAGRGEGLGERRDERLAESIAEDSVGDLASNLVEEPLADESDDRAAATTSLSSADLRSPIPVSGDEEDDDIAGIFIEEAEDLMHSSAETLGRWAEDRHNMPLVHSLQRDLHTLKGGARLAGQRAIADLAHVLESLFEALSLERIAVGDDAVRVATSAHDGLATMVIDLRHNGHSKSAPALISMVQEFISRAQTATSGPAVESEDDRITGIDTGAELSLDELDIETVELFIEEADEILHRTGEILGAWTGAAEDRSRLAALQRDLHTLKGGARLASIRAVGDLAHEMETLFEQMATGQRNASPAAIGLLLDCHDRLAQTIEAIKAHEPLPATTDLIARLQACVGEPAEAEAGAVAAADVLEAADTALSDASGNEDLAPLPGETMAAVSQDIDDGLAVPTSQSAMATDDTDNRHATDADHFVPVPSTPADLRESAPEILFDPAASDVELMELFLAEAHELTHETASRLHDWHEKPEDAGTMRALQRALHTLKGGARLAEIRPIGDLAHALETLLEGLVDGHLQPSAEIVSLTHAANDRLVEMIDSVAAGRTIRSANAILRQIESLGQGETAAPAPATVSADSGGEHLRRVFLGEARQFLANMAGAFDRWQMGDTAAIAAMAQEAEKLGGAASLAGIGSLGRLAETLQRFLGQRHATETGQATALAERALRELSNLLDRVDAREEPRHPAELIDELSRQLHKPDTGPNLQDIDDDILQVFIEEAEELLGGLQRAYDDWRRDISHGGHALVMQRQLHTLKGGARLATLTQIGDVAQELESVVKDAHLQKRDLDATLQAEITPLLNRLQQKVEQVKSGYRQLQISEKARAMEAASPLPGNRAIAEKVVQLQREQAAAPTRAPDKVAPEAARQTQRAQATDSVRVTAGLLDSLVNLAGETSITRGLLEQQISDFSHTLSEMQATIDRLREQLRRMDIETEAQVLFRMEKEAGPAYEDFDPLEMDRYSSIQQLSRALSESASDLTDLRETLLERSRGAETLLLQQARINTELQEGLMKTRMVPFTSIVPRLRRIVRQVAGELGKQANFEVFNPEGELDRTVLERMVAPFEHMLRNAMDHGIESPDKRRLAGKPETGTITLSVNREGGDVVIVLSDDGAGINVGAVRRKAIKQGLIDADAEIPDQEILQFIFKAGFSTAEKVTQLSGRGVGMDVVSSEIKQLGGRVAIHSEPGKGTRFVIHLPFTVSVNRALMVSTGEDYYAIPLNTIEGIVRVSTYELEEYYKPGAPLYEYAGQRYRLQYLGSLLHSGSHPILQGQQLPLPVILVRGGDQPLALQVNNLLGSREIVVKGLGRQFAGVRGVSGATILGDGSVVVILDLPAMLRNEYSPLLRHTSATKEAKGPTGPRTVMVVDDSVTVRKVTTRLLERHGMEVITAKDGVDAIALLQEHKPDIMLLDIEMPRMDGFEVASLVRHDKRLTAMPIIMITSRTGQKHRERALAIGVNEYMGKPFQEKNLLEAIERLTEEK